MNWARWLPVAIASLSSCGGGDGSESPAGSGGSGGRSGSSGEAGSNGSGSSSGGASSAGEGGEAGARAGASGEAGAGGAGAGGASPCTFEVTSSISPVISTVGIVEWSSDFAETETARIEFGLGVTYGMVAPVEPAELAEPSHRTLLLGMKSSRVYHFRIVAESSSGACASEDFTLETGPLPSDLPAVSLVDHAPGTPVGGFLVASFLLDGPAFILDADGDTVWWYGSGEMGRASMNHAGSHLWFSGVNVAGGNASMKRVTMDGLVEDDFSADFEELHHDFTVLPDETIAFIRHDGERDLVVERAPDGTLTTIFDVSSAHGGSMQNHANSIHYRADDDTYTVSDLSQDAYVKATRQGDVVWVLGGSTSDFTGDGATWQAQHGHHVLGDDRFLFFSNGPFQGPSQVIEVTLDLQTMTATRVWQYVSSERSIIFGDVERLANGNTLVTYSSFGVLHEVSPTGELVQELQWEPSAAVGYVTKRASLYGPPNE